MSQRLNRSEPIIRIILELPVLEQELGQETIYEYVESYHFVYGCTAKANTNFYI